MSDEIERNSRALIGALIEVYETLRLICTGLPIPITLPKQETEFDGAITIQAVSRLVEIIEDQPIREFEKAMIWGASLQWLSANKLISRYLNYSADQVSRMEIELLIQHSGDALIAYLEGEEETDTP
ncbi:hypothetical protein L1085_016285 [Streptomyces sp. MSC1_001]|jgi:hypothetical protein|uniref:hypothetical protein n=1 Tax=Streptomyces sp. MSC1_001 TaxID=2909263 RepID=UPI00202E7A9D|nr:hypothetical protein [Streptomyces sp. MSC1_001]